LSAAPSIRNENPPRCSSPMGFKCFLVRHRSLKERDNPKALYLKGIANFLELMLLVRVTPLP